MTGFDLRIEFANYFIDDRLRYASQFDRACSRNKGRAVVFTRLHDTVCHTPVTSGRVLPDRAGRAKRGPYRRAADRLTE